LGPIGDYVLFGCAWHPALNFPGISELNAEHQAKFGRSADVMTGPAYASIQVIADAIERAGSVEPEKIRDAFIDTSMMTVVGHVKFRPDGTVLDPFYGVGQWHSGRPQLVWPEDIRTKPLIYPVPKWDDR
jgi:branched-chain amino acid transport system substrate-binding protein